MSRAANVVGFALLALPAIWLVGAGITSGVLELQNQFSWKPEFNREVHGHIENAYYANTPDLMIQELEAAVQGMHELGLGTGDYCDMRPWKHVPSCSMGWQYAHLESIIERAKAVEADRVRQERQGTSDQLGDVYEEKMDNLRYFIQEDGWSDDVARNAFYVKQHPFYAAWWDFSGVALLSWIGFAVLTVPAGLFLASRGY